LVGFLWGGALREDGGLFEGSSQNQYSKSFAFGLWDRRVEVGLSPDPSAKPNGCEKDWKKRIMLLVEDKS
jgi:hypothetical protein